MCDSNLRYYSDFLYSINLSYSVLAISRVNKLRFQTNLAAKDEACNGKINLLQQIYYIREDYIPGFLKGQYFSCKTDTTMSEHAAFPTKGASAVADKAFYPRN